MSALACDLALYMALIIGYAGGAAIIAYASLVVIQRFFPKLYEKWVEADEDATW